ncbi:MAG: hypothetical protein Q8O13_06540, partial [Candidatus Omnitrophota bacterium]|nr:hypothetical protein [Candidatus Omnitrophota bacterium]
IWYLSESPMPGPYGQPLSEWDWKTGKPTGWGDLMKYTEQAGGTWMWVERISLGTSAIASIAASGIIAGPMISSGLAKAASATGAFMKATLATPVAQQIVKQILPPLLAAWMRWVAMEVPPNPVIWEEAKTTITMVIK